MEPTTKPWVYLHITAEEYDLIRARRRFEELRAVTDELMQDDLPEKLPLLHALGAFKKKEAEIKKVIQDDCPQKLCVKIFDRDYGTLFQDRIDTNEAVIGCTSAGTKALDMLLSLRGSAAKPRTENAAQFWEEMRKRKIPSYVTEVTFTVPNDDQFQTREKEVRDQFPGVTITRPSSSMEVGTQTHLSASATGTSTATQTDIAVATPGESKSTQTNPTIHTQTSNATQTDRNRFMQTSNATQTDQSTYMNTSNSTQTNRIGLMQASNATQTDSTTFNQTCNATQTDSTPSTQASNATQTNPSASTLRMSHGAQTNRIAVATAIAKGTQTNLTAAMEALFGQTQANERHRKDNLVRQDTSGATRYSSVSSEQTDTTTDDADSIIYVGTRSAKKNPASLERFEMEGISDAQDVIDDLDSPVNQELQDVKDVIDSLEVSHDPNAQDEKTSGSDLLHPFFEAVNRLQLSIRAPRLVEAILKDWSKHRSIPYFKKYVSIEDFYTCLVDIYIVANKTAKSELRLAALLAFQATSLKETDSLPNFDVVVKAFQYLDDDSSLCKWIAILYAHQWSTVEERTYTRFCENFDESAHTHEAVSRLLFEIARIRCPFAPGTADAVLQEWCSVHSHTPGDASANLCKATLKKNDLRIKQAKDAERDRKLGDAMSVIKDHGGEVILKSKREEKPATPRGQKRKTSTLLESTPKRGAHGSGRGGAGRGPGRPFGSVKHTPGSTNQTSGSVKRSRGRPPKSLGV